MIPSRLYSIALAALLVAAPAPAFATDVPAALAPLKAAADAGNTDAALQLAGRYYRGEGVNQNYAAALVWYKRAAALGEPSAAMQVAKMLDLGAGTPRDLEGSNVYYRQAAKQGLPAAQVILGTRLRDGLGVSANEAEAAQWFRRAAERGDADGMFHLGQSYARGSGVDEDPREALMWYELAAEQFHRLACCEIGRVYDEGLGVETDPIRAAKWYETAARLGDPEAQYRLGMLLKDGAQPLPANRTEAERWLRQAAEQKQSQAEGPLGELLFQKGSHREAYEWVRPAAERGEAPSVFRLAVMLDEGKGVPRNLELAAFWYHVAVKYGVAGAKERLAKLNGRLGARERESAAFKAKRWLESRGE